MKKVFSIIAAGILFLGQAGWVAADTKTFTVSATIPSATGVGINAFQYDAATNNRTAVTGTALNFNPMTFNASTNVFLPNHYFAIEVAPVSGSGNTDVTLSYTEGANPASPNHGLGWRSVATFFKVTGGSTETALSSHGPKKMLKDLAGEHVTPAELASAFLRVYVGIVTKDPGATIPDPASSEVFTNATPAGNYDGSLVVTATVT